MNRKGWFALALAICGAPAWGQFKCVDNSGRTTFQQAPCAVGDRSERVRVFAGEPSKAPPKAGATPEPARPVPPAAEPAPARTPPPERAPKSQDEIDAGQCLDWYRPLLRDPRGAYWRDVVRDGRVLSITIHATNGFGGYVPRAAACEFTKGALDNGWTKIHARDRNWPVPR